MSCNHPYKAFKTGCLTANGKEDFVLVMSEYDSALNVMYARKKKPINLARAPHEVMEDGKVYLVDPFPVPCGKCSGCRRDRAREWKNRLCLEAGYYKHVYFLTLTYSDKFVPIDRDTGIPSLNKKDLQGFFKRLRHKWSFRYFACGEYGDTTARPHYHAILFSDVPLPLDIFAVNKYHCPFIQDSWKLGLHEVSEADNGCIAYVAGYCNKKIKDPDWDTYPVKPFVLMSRRPGIAALYSHRDFFLQSMKIYGNFDGKGFGSAPLPRYFRNMVKDDPRYDPYKESTLVVSKALMATSKALVGDSVEAIGQYRDKIDSRYLSKKRKVIL